MIIVSATKDFVPQVEICPHCRNKQLKAEDKSACNECGFVPTIFDVNFASYAFYNYRRTQLFKKKNN
jgi:hypothetical protein